MVAYDDVAIVHRENDMIHVIWYRVVLRNDAEGVSQRYEYSTFRTFPLRSIHIMMNKYGKDVDREFRARHTNEKYKKWLAIANKKE